MSVSRGRSSPVTCRPVESGWRDDKLGLGDLGDWVERSGQVGESVHVWVEGSDEWVGRASGWADGRVG